MSEYATVYNNMPVIALRGLVVFPEMVLHFDVGREKSVNALKYAMEHSQKIFMSAQKDILCDDPDENGIYSVGVIAEVRQMLKIPNTDTMRVVVEGVCRATLTHLEQSTPFLSGCVALCEDTEPSKASLSKSDGYIRAVKKRFEQYAALLPKLHSDLIVKIMAVKEPGKLADLIASNTYFEYSVKQKLLSQLDPIKRIATLIVELEKETKALKTEKEIHDKLQSQIEENQREYYLREEMKVIAEELGENDNPADDADEYNKKIASLSLSDEARQKLLKESAKLVKMPSGSHEGSVIRSYLDSCLEIPFGVYTKDNIDLQKAQKLLDKEHYGLDKVKQRIIEILAVRKLAPDITGQIICLAGPPGVGKTSIAKSLAKAMGRNYVRVSLGGIKDESEIRGHRRTYVGSMPGRIISALKNAKAMNAFILLDEIDKLGFDGRGDPSSALLEALDPEQNYAFTDHYIDFPVDLSKVLFVTTANDVSAIPAPLFDRMEIIELGSYTHNEKFNIAKKHLIKKQTARHGLTAKSFKINDEALNAIIENYTKEAGVRSLERQIAAACRKAACAVANDSTAVFKINKSNLVPALGSPRYKDDVHSGNDQIGVVNGLAWTSVGGTMLPIEITALEGTGKLKLTGNLGDVMQESAQTAVSYVRSKTKEYNVDALFYKNKDIHIHAPESAIPKDGPSAGVAITTALVSELTGTPIDHTVAMTGEISLKGNVLPIGGLKEKSMAAYRAGIEKVIIPYDNLGDLDDVDSEVKNKIKFFPVRNYREVLPIAFESADVIKADEASDVTFITKTKKIKSAHIITQ